MAHAEDCSTVLEQFVHDANSGIVANLPAEISHLMEEIQAKDKIIQECRALINSRDGSLQKFIKLNGSHALNPKEESYSNAILQNMDRSQVLQDEKIALSEKAAVILDRHIKKLDIKIRDLQNDGILSNDPPIPSLFSTKDTYRDTKSIFFTEAAQADTYPSPLNPTSGNAALPANLLQRLNSATTAAAGMSGTAGSTGRNSAPATPGAAALHFQQRQRESSAGATENKRRRLNASLTNLPAAPSGLRQSSLGPGTPKAGTPGATRAGSAGPRTTTATKKATIKKVAPHQQVRKIKAGATASKTSKRSSSGNGRLKPVSGNTASRKRSPASAASMLEEEDESMLSSADLSESENNVSRRQAGRDSDEEMEDEEDEGGEDTKVYCTCRSVSHGDMVACDNDNCPYEWFHWKCVGLTREPLGTWYCEECRRESGQMS
ncbi:conserved hypothetical protein [Uncinocarpus reesii 1704]|uniref:Chromatin modification-related protein n=1 Tax=Uncinocarpus reesii (strain UAMH 1704) TaxID=336963 RepID=C4JJ85_UNCRE|nr:uncharacterized protein UREG_01692 [Uncinocarpus reesii 1704]EEP76843.1 conserved hypothetical protein [Uncinocarpus reesii 1704]